MNNSGMPQSDNSENVVTLICQKLQNFAQNSYEDNVITLSVVDKILCNKLSLPEVENDGIKHEPNKRNNQLNFIK